MTAKTAEGKTLRETYIERRKRVAKLVAEIEKTDQRMARSAKKILFRATS